MIFELDRFEKKYYPGQEIAPAENYNYSTDVEAMSLLYWAEHCVECAAPGCYQTCDLYQPRPDKRCRRLTFGAKKNRHFPSLRGYGVEIAFKKWAKLEAFANMSLSPIDTVLRGEKAIEAGAPVLNLVGMAMSKLKPKSRWLSATHVVLESLVRHLHRSRKTRGTPDAFLLEVYNPAGQTVRIQINIVPFAFPQTDTTALVGLKHSFRTTVLCPPGYSRNEIEASQFCHLMKEEQPLLVSMIPEADSEARLVLLSADFVKFSSRHNATRKIKCVVLDLDNTLWEGILVEGDEVQLRPEIPPLLKHLDERGILLSIASKNDFDLAWGKLQELGVSDYFLHPQISWAPKSHGVRKIAERLNLGLDSFAFIDDNPFELEQVTAACPEVLCLAQASIPGLIKDQRFQGSVTADSSRRRLLYKEAVTREAEQEKFGSDIQSFLARSDIRLEISEYVEADEERVAELVQRTNQLNCSGHKYTREQMKQILKDPQLEKYVLKCSDRYGSYGTIGFSLIERSETLIQIRDFMLSCRVQGKFLEKAFFAHLMAHHGYGPALRLWVNFQETSRNGPAHEVLKTLGFRKCDPISDRLLTGMVYDAADDLRCDLVRVEGITPLPGPVAARNLIVRKGGHLA